MSGLGLLAAIVLTIYIAHLWRGWRLRRRIVKWSTTRIPMTDGQFYSALQPTQVTKCGAMNVRKLVAGAVRVPMELVYPDDTLRELKEVGDPSHPSVMDYIVDFTSIKGREDEDDLATVRDLVMNVGPELDDFEARALPQRLKPH